MKRGWDDGRVARSLRVFTPITREGEQFQILSLWRYRKYNTWTSIGTALGLLRKEKGDGTQ